MGSPTVMFHFHPSAVSIFQCAFQLKVLAATSHKSAAIPRVRRIENRDTKDHIDALQAEKGRSPRVVQRDLRVKRSSNMKRFGAFINMFDARTTYGPQAPSMSDSKNF